MLKSDIRVLRAFLLLSLSMNYLAHAHLSFNHRQVLIGNMISDFVKGKKQFDFSPGIQKGIRLHRFIDTFTDEHPVTKEMKNVFKPVYGLYAGAFTDIVYDYFLANDQNEFQSVKELDQFSNFTYSVLEDHLEQLPPGFQKMFPYMKLHNWLLHYREDWGIQKSFGGLVRRARYMDDAETAFIIFKEHMPKLETLYHDFFPSLKDHAAKKLETLLNSD